MRALIRPALFAVARLGLFLAVVAWIISQTYVCVGVFSAGNHHARILASPPGWMFILWPRSDEFSVQFHPVVELKEYVVALDAIFGADIDSDYTIETHSFGFVLGKAESVAPYCAIRHWLVVSILIAFNLVLHFVYRNRPETQQ